MRDVSQALFDAHADSLAEIPRQRACHVLGENQRVLDAVACMDTNDAVRFGELMNASHDSLRDFYAVSCEELDALVDIARDTPGVLGARMTGAGFGGCTVNLVAREAVSDLLQRIETEYPQRCGLKPESLVVQRSLEADAMTA